MEENIFYIYVYLDDRYPGQWNYNNIYTFKCQPFYIGKGKHHRINHHLQPNSLCDNSIKSNTINAIIKQKGRPPTHYKIAEKLSFEEANELETNLIKHFGRRDIKTGILTNMTDGGEGFKNIRFSLKTKYKMSQAKKGKVHGKLNPRSKRVQQFDLDNNLLREWDALSDITKETGMEFRKISKCCLGHIPEAFGFKWKYNGTAYERREIVPEAKDRRKVVYQYDLDGNFIQSYESMSNAKRHTNISNIDGVCLGKNSHAGGFQWFYEFKGDKIDALTLHKQDRSFQRKAKQLL